VRGRATVKVAPTKLYKIPFLKIWTNKPLLKKFAFWWINLA
jgi:hypothetical protein